MKTIYCYKYQNIKLWNPEAIYKSPDKVFVSLFFLKNDSFTLKGKMIKYWHTIFEHFDEMLSGKKFAPQLMTQISFFLFLIGFKIRIEQGDHHFQLQNYCLQQLSRLKSLMMHQCCLHHLILVCQGMKEAPLDQPHSLVATVEKIQHILIERVRIRNK